MNTNEQILFIKNPISGLLNKIVNATQILGDGMTFYAVNEYLLQSVFLQMTGAQEQKMKCICWELATNNLEYRYKRFYQKWELSECSTLDAKMEVLSDIINEITKLEHSYPIPFTIESDKKKLIQKVTNTFKLIFEEKNIVTINKKKFEKAKQFIEHLNLQNISFSTNKKHEINIKFNQDSNKGKSKKVVILDPFLDINALFKAYEYLYRHRNRCAHNTKSFQLNLPHLDNLRDTTYQGFDNIFIFFIVLIIIDEIAMQLFEKYESLLKKH